MRSTFFLNWHSGAQAAAFVEAAVSRFFVQVSMEEVQYDGRLGKVTEITLSSSKSQVKVISNDFACVAQHLLTEDPQIKWDDYLWFDDDPLALPPITWTMWKMSTLVLLKFRFNPQQRGN
jgi:hypothetical protein